MKKTATVLLALVMLLSLVAGAIPASAADTASTDVRPFYGLAWSPVDETMFPNCDDVITIGIRPTGDKQLQFYKDNPELGTDVNKLLNWVKTEMDKRPEGTRYLHIFGTLNVAGLNPKDVIDLSDGFDKMKVLWTDFLQRYKDMGGVLDGLVLDCEYMRTFAWQLYQQRYNGSDKQVYNTIVNSDLYKNEIRDQLVERGFKFYDNVGGEKSEIYSIHPYSGDAYVESRRIWDRVMRNKLNDYMSETLYEPFIAQYPNGWVSDYQSTDSYGWLKGMGDSGAPSWTGGNSIKVGNTSNANAYGYAPNDEFYISKNQVVYTNPVAYNDAVFAAGPFNNCMWDINEFKRMYLATDTEKITAWLAGYDYNEKQGGRSYSDTAYYSELILHIGMLDPDPFLMYIYRGDYESDRRYNAAVQVFSELMSELTRVVGAADRKPIQVQESWNYDFLLSGMYAGGKNYWRITPNDQAISLKNFKTDDATPTFYVNGVKVTFPEGKIIEDGKITKLGTCGYWVETPANVQPIITTDADRYSKSPSYLADFEDYKAGTEITNATALPETAWTVTGTSPVVKEVSGNKVLALTGSTTMTNVKLPENISAGDYYAKQQAWEITVTLPAGLSSDAIVTLLTAGSGTGFKIQGGKLYYSQKGQYAQMTGVDLSAGGTYTLRREIDVRTVGAFTSNYAVFDASGKELASVKGVEVTGLTDPVVTIGFGCANVNKEVYVDNYKLYPTGFTADLEIFDASAGVLTSQGEKGRDESSAYRLSWLNGTDAAKSATVVATYFDASGNKVDEKVMADILMMPGADGVATGIAEVANGQTVKITMQINDNPDVSKYPAGVMEPVGSVGGSDSGNQGGNDDPVDNTTGDNNNNTTDNNQTPTDGTDKGDEKGSSSLVIVLIVVVVVVVGLIAVAIFMPAKKKPAAEETAEEAAPAEEAEAAEETETAEETDENKE